MAHALLIGYGNSLRSDDGLGWRVAREIEKTADSATVQVITCQQLNPELAEIISRAPFVVFVDAAQLNPGAPGSIIEADLEPECQAPQCFSHDLTPSTLLACAAELFGSTPRAKLFSVVGSDFGMGEQLSPAVEASLPELLQKINLCLRAALLPA